MGERKFVSGAERNNAEGKGRYDLIPPCVLQALAQRLELGAQEHGEFNFMLGIPNKSLYDSAYRHLTQARAGMKDEPHLAAALTNIAFLIYNEVNGIGDEVPATYEDMRKRITVPTRDEDPDFTIN